MNVNMQEQVPFAVSLKGHTMFSHVKCIFIKDQSKKLSRLSKNDKVSIIGKISGGLMGPILNECILY